MAESDYNFLEQEVKELLQNYKNKKSTVYEPCTTENYMECLIGLREELGLYNINYIFNPYTDLEDNQLSLDALVTLINATWSLLYAHKNSMDKNDRIVEQNHTLGQKVKELNQLINNLKHKVDSKNFEARSCVASAQRTLDRSDEVLSNLTNTKAQLTQVTKQKETMEKQLKTEITRLHLENEQLRNKLKNKSGSFTPCVNICDDTILRLKQKEKKQNTIISQLQTNNQDLLLEVIALKENLFISSLNN